MRFDGNVYYHECEPYPVDVMVDEWRETAVMLDQAGFTSCWLGEHHFWYDGYPSATPNPILVGMHLADATKRLRVAQSACILPDHHPIRLAEDLAMLDHLCKGRLDVGIARGPTAAPAYSSTSTPTGATRRPTTACSRRPSTSCSRPGPRTR